MKDEPGGHRSFTMRGIHFRGWPPVPGTSAFPELNVRTYVTCNGCPGVWFFSLDAANRLAVRAARATHLPYFDADMTVVPHQDGVAYASWRTHRDGGTAEFVGRYGPAGAEYQKHTGSLEHWLTERYRLFAADRAGRLYRGEIEHQPWPLQPARAEFSSVNMTGWMGLETPGRTAAPAVREESQCPRTPPCAGLTSDHGPPPQINVRTKRFPAKSPG